MYYFLKKFTIVSLVIMYTINGFATPNSDFLLGIDGASMVIAHGHHCVIEQKTDEGIGGRAQCWGYDDHNKLNAPKDVDFIQLIGGFTFSCGITVDQTVLCWGSMKGSVQGLYEQITAPDSGNFACGVLIDGNINCWGHSPIGEHMQKIEPNKIRFVQISCSNYHCCALDDNAYPHCFGSNLSEELKIPTISYTEYLRSLDSSSAIHKSILQTPDEEEEDFESELQDKQETRNDDDNDESNEVISKIQFRQISVGDGISCGITLIGSNLHCWGGHQSLQGINHRLPVKTSKGPYKQISVGRKGICALTGDRDGEDAASPSSTDTTTMNTRNTKSTEDKTIIKSSDMLECWGGIALALVQENHLNESKQWDQISVGHTSICGVTMDSEMICFGEGIPNFDFHSKFIVA